MKLYCGLGSCRSWAARTHLRFLVKIVQACWSLQRLCARAGCLLSEHFSLRRLLTLSSKDAEYGLRTLLTLEPRLRTFV